MTTTKNTEAIKDLESLIESNLESIDDIDDQREISILLDDAKSIEALLEII